MTNRTWLLNRTLSALAPGCWLLVACGAPSGARDNAPQSQAGATATAGVGGAVSGAGGSNSAGGLPSSGGAGAGGQLGNAAGALAGGSSGAAGEAQVGGGNSSGGAGGAGSAGSAGSGGSAGGPSQGWVGTWATAEQLTETANNPPTPGLTDNTLRQIVRVSIGGKRLRLRFSNEYGSAPVTLKKVHVAASTGASAITVGTDKELAFAGAASVTIPAKAAVFSDPFDFTLAPLSNVAVSINFGATASDVTGHPGSRTTSYLQAGDQVAAASLASAATADHWYIISGIDVMADPASRALVVLGDSITDGRGSTTNGNDRWPDALATRLQMNPSTTGVGVLNKGIGGNTVLIEGLGPPATARFDVDVLQPSGARWLIVFEGVNDLGVDMPATTSDLTNAYQALVTKAHGAGLLAFGATILPFKGHSYYTSEHEAARTTVNEWIRKPGNFDAVIDLDAVARDPQKSDTLISTYDSGDHLHLNPAGYKKLAEAVDLSLFK